MEVVGKRAIRNHMLGQHREFFAQLPFIIAGSVDQHGDAWATLLAGKPGFMVAPTPYVLDIDARADPRDPASEGLQEGNAIGLLGIELHTRRRNRLNGVLRDSPAGTLRVWVDQSFGNCPQYIQRRDSELVREPDAPFTGSVETGTTIDPPARKIIDAADTFFVASYADREDRRQVDVSHRGGPAGFVHIGDDGVLTIPDFSGNLFFSTLGNILLNGRAGLLFIDFETGDVLQMTGDAHVILDSPEIARFPGAERLWTFQARHVVRRPAALPLRGSLV